MTIHPTSGCARLASACRLRAIAASMIWSSITHCRTKRRGLASTMLPARPFRDMRDIASAACQAIVVALPCNDPQPCPRDRWMNCPGGLGQSGELPSPGTRTAPHPKGSCKPGAARRPWGGNASGLAANLRSDHRANLLWIGFSSRKRLRGQPRIHAAPVCGQALAGLRECGDRLSRVRTLPAAHRGGHRGGTGFKAGWRMLHGQMLRLQYGASPRGCTSSNPIFGEQ
jgi:hypothetical protein